MPRVKPAARPFPRYDGDRYVVSESVGQQLVGLLTMMRREVEARMAAHGLTDAQWRPLWLIKSGQATTPREIARHADIDAGSMTRMLDRLQAKGLVERVRSQADRRMVNLRLTAEGEQVVRQVPHVLAAVNNDFLAGFSQTEWQQLRKLLARMGANGQALRAAGASA